MQKIDFESKKEAIAEIAKKHGLNLVVLFGSQATGRAYSKSDVDVAILARQPIRLEAQIKVGAELSNAFKRDDVELVDLADASPTLMRVVVEDGRALYERESDTFFNWKLRALTEWRETAWLRDLRNKKLLEWANAQ
ncbi:MAG: nucleotidyltransferase domain-containing protein [Patescibacteria group bacterium]